MRWSDAARWLALGVALASLVAGCRSLPIGNAVRKDSSVLAVDVRFPFPLSRDPTLIRVWLARGPVHAGMGALPPLVSTSFVKGSRAYLLDPEPGTYSLVAVAFDHAPPLRTDPAAGVTGVVASGNDAGQTIVLSETLIRRTRTSIGHGLVSFMGALEIGRGVRIQAGTPLHDALQREIAERIQPGVTSKTGMAGMLSVMWTLDPDASTFTDDPQALDAFQRDARADFGASPWAALLPAPEREDRRRPPRRATRKPATAVVSPVPTTPPTAVAPPDPAPTPVAIPAPEPAPAVAPTEIAAPSPSPAPAAEPPEEDWEAEDDLGTDGDAADGAGDDQTIAALQPPPGHPLAPIEIGMTGEDVEAILGGPDDRERSRTRRAWIPFYTGPDAVRITWIYTDRGRVVFSVDDGNLEVIDVVYEAARTPQ